MVTEIRILSIATSLTNSLQWSHNEHDGVSNHQRLCRFLKRLFRRRSKKTSKLRVAGLCEGNSPVTGEFPSQRASNAENVSIWWRHHVQGRFSRITYDMLLLVQPLTAWFGSVGCKGMMINYTENHECLESSQFRIFIIPSNLKLWPFVAPATSTAGMHGWCCVHRWWSAL